MREERSKPRRRPLSYFEAQDRVVGLGNIYRASAFGADRAKNLAQDHHRALDETVLPEPDEGAICCIALYPLSSSQGDCR